MRVFLFPGQGSQEIGMGADLFRSSAVFRELIRTASQHASMNLEHICLHGPESTLRQSKCLQPLLVCVSLGYHQALLERGLRPDLLLGHSLGEISALAAAGVVTGAEAVGMAAQRGCLMDEAAAALRGGMLAVTTTVRDAFLRWLSRFGPERNLVVANDNAPSQIVVSGDLETLKWAAEHIQRERLGKTRLLPVSGPWHSPSIETARQQFMHWAQTLVFRPPITPLLMNLTAEMTTDPQEIRRAITDILVQPVQWAACMTRLRAMHPAALFEVGPGRILSGLARINGFGNETPIYNVNNLRGAEAAAAAGCG